MTSKQTTNPERRPGPRAIDFRKSAVRALILAAAAVRDGETAQAAECIGLAVRAMALIGKVRP